jgi:hypothetical protein
MANEKKPGEIFKFTEPAIMVWPKLVTPESYENKPEGSFYFSTEFLFDPASKDLETLKALWLKLIRENSQAPLDTFNKLFKSGDKKADGIAEKKKSATAGAFYRGKVIFTTSTGVKYPPKLGVFPSGNPKDGALDLGNDEALIKKYAGTKNGDGWFYTGALGLAVVNLKWYKAKNESQKSGVKAYLANIVSTGKGEKLAGGSSSTSNFGAYTGHVSETDPTIGQEKDDEIPY